MKLVAVAAAGRYVVSAFTTTRSAAPDWTARELRLGLGSHLEDMAAPRCPAVGRSASCCLGGEGPQRGTGGHVASDARAKKVASGVVKKRLRVRIWKVGS